MECDCATTRPSSGRNGWANLAEEKQSTGRGEDVLDLHWMAIESLNWPNPVNGSTFCCRMATATR